MLSVQLHDKKKRGGSEISFHADAVRGSKLRCGEYPTLSAEAAGIPVTHHTLGFQPAIKARISINSQNLVNTLPCYSKTTTTTLRWPHLSFMLYWHTKGLRLSFFPFTILFIRYVFRCRFGNTPCLLLSTLGKICFLKSWSKNWTNELLSPSIEGDG